METCKPCPDGVHCPLGARYGLPNSTTGYYVLPQGSLIVEPCNPKELCLGANQCKGANQGLLCEQCKEGYSNKGLLSPGKTCRKCLGFIWNLFIVCFMCLSLLYIGRFLRKEISSSSHIQEITSAMMKICISYLQFAGIAFQATEFVDMAEEVSQGWSFFLWPLITLANLVVNPLEALVSFPCLARSQDVREDRVSIILAFLLMPAAIIVNISVLWLKRRLKICLWYRRYRALRHVAQKAIAREYAAQKAVMGDGEDTSYSMSMDDSSGTETKGVDSSVTTHTPAHPAIMDITESNEALAARRAWRALEHKDKHSWMQSSIVWCFILHAITVRLLLTPFECLDLDVLRLKSNLHVECASEENFRWILWSLIGLLLYGLGTPLVLFKMLYHVSDRLNQVDVRRSVGFLYNGFETHLYFFEPLYMFRKVLLLLISVVPTRFVRMVGMFILSSSFLFIHSRCQPYDNRDYLCLDTLEFISLRALMITVAGRLIFDVCREIGPTDGSMVTSIVENPLTDIFIVGMVVACHAWFIIFTLWCFFRHTLLKQIKMKAEIWPEKTTWLHRIVLGAVGVNKINLDEKTLFLDTSSLSQRERFFLFTGLSDTMERYVDVVSKIHPALVTSAVHHAFHRAKHSREARLTKLVHLRTLSKGHVFERIRGEYRLSMQGTTGMSRIDLGEITRDLEKYDDVERDVRQVEKLTQEGVYVEELYYHLMLVWPDILQHHPKFFELPSYTPHDTRALQSVTPMMLARSLSAEHKEAARTLAPTGPWHHWRARPPEELSEDMIQDLFGPQIDLHGRAKEHGRDPETLLEENRQLVKESVELYDQNAELKRQYCEIRSAVQSKADALELATSLTNLGTEDSTYLALGRELFAARKAVKEAEAELEYAISVAKAAEEPPVEEHSPAQRQTQMLASEFSFARAAEEPPVEEYSPAQRQTQMLASDYETSFAEAIQQPHIGESSSADLQASFAGIMRGASAPQPPHALTPDALGQDRLQFTGCMLQPANQAAWARHGMVASI